MGTGFASEADRWWWCVGHQQAELNPAGVTGGAASVGHRWVGPYRSKEDCEQSGPQAWPASA